MPSLPPVFSHRSSALSANLLDRSSRPSREHSEALPDLPTVGEFVSGSTRAEVQHGRGLTEVPSRVVREQKRDTGIQRRPNSSVPQLQHGLLEADRFELWPMPVAVLTPR